MIQFKHERKYNKIGELTSKGGETIAFDSIQPWFFDTLEEGIFFERLVGKARCSNEENFSRKIGRDLARSRMKNTKLTVLKVERTGGTHFAVLSDSKGGLYGLERKKDRVYFVEYCNE